MSFKYVHIQDFQIEINSNSNIVNVFIGSDHIGSYNIFESSFIIYHPEVFDNIPASNKIIIQDSYYDINGNCNSFMNIYNFLKNLKTE